MGRIRRFIGAASACALFFVTMVVVDSVPASSEPCGLQVSTSTTLSGDVSGCSGVTPITVTGDNLTLDLNGKTVACVPDVAGEGPGIYVPSRTNVTIKNGTVRDCDTGIYLEGGGRHTLTALNVLENIGHLNGAGIFGEGIQLYNSHDNRIISNRVIHNGTFSGINAYDSSRNTISNNLVDRNNVIQIRSPHGGTIMQDIGIWLAFIGDFPDPGVTGNVVSHNSVTNNGLDGVQLSTGTRSNSVLSNTILLNGYGQTPGVRNGDGIAVFGQSSLIQANSVSQNGGNGIYVRNNRLNHRILNNQAVNNNKVAGPAPQFDLKDDNANCDNNVWQGNPQGTRNQACIL